MDRSKLLAHLRKTHFAPGDRDRAFAERFFEATAKAAFMTDFELDVKSRGPRGWNCETR